MLDVDRLTKAIHEATLHNTRGGVDDEMGRLSCSQFGPMARCRRQAEAIAEEYERLTIESGPRLAGVGLGRGKVALPSHQGRTLGGPE